MTSPITHEKIIEVLRPFAEYDDGGIDHFEDNSDISIRVLAGEIRAARDLYQRLQAEKEGGAQRVATAPAEWPGSTEEVLADLVRCIDDDYRYVPHSEALLRARLKLTEGDDPDLATGCADDNSELGNAVEAILSRPPASANAGTGRAIAEQPKWVAMDKAANLITALLKTNPGTPSRAEAAAALLNFNASEHQRGLAEGERIGIEKAAKVADDHPLSPSPVKTAERIVSAIRALTGDPQT